MRHCEGGQRRMGRKKERKERNGEVRCDNVTV